MHHSLFKLVLCAVLIPGIGWTAGPQDYTPGLRGPVIGYVLDTTKQAIRPVNGIPGSALLGESLAFGFPIVSAAFAPHGDFALALSGRGGNSLYIVRNLSAAVAVDLIEGDLISADHVILNSNGSVGALFDGETRQIQLLRGLPAAPTVELPIDLSSVPGTITALAIDGKGANVLIAAASDHGAVYLASADKPIRAIGDFGSPSALALSRNDQDVVVADTATNQITIVRNFAGTPEAEWIAGERDGVSRPVGLAVTPDGRSLYIANASTRTLDVWSLEAQAIDKSLPLDAEPTRLSSFLSSSMFVLNDVGNHPLLLLEAGRIPAVYFVPAGGEQ